MIKPSPILCAGVERLAGWTKDSQAPQYLLDMLQRSSVMAKGYSHPNIQQDLLFQANYPHLGGRNCHFCNKQRIIQRDIALVRIYNIIRHKWISEKVIKNANLREELRRGLKHICLETAAAGLMDLISLPGDSRYMWLYRLAQNQEVQSYEGIVVRHIFYGRGRSTSCDRCGPDFEKWFDFSTSSPSRCRVISWWYISPRRCCSSFFTRTSGRRVHYSHLLDILHSSQIAK